MINANSINTWKILIIDDEPDNLNVAEKVLTFNGATVETATNGLEGLAKLKDNQYSFILLDLSMPHMDGWTMFETMRQDDTLKSIPVIALTAHAMDADKKRAKNMGFDGYITKPFRIDNFLENLRELVQNFAVSTQPPTEEAQEQKR